MAKSKLPKLATLEDLKPITITVVLTLADGEERTVNMRLLSTLRCYQIENSIPDPQPPIQDYGAKGVPIYDLKDPVYLQKRLEAVYQRKQLLLAEMMGLNVKGDTAAERLANIGEKLDPIICETLMRLIGEITKRPSARIVSRTPEPAPKTKHPRMLEGG